MKSQNATVEVNPKQMDAIYAAVSRDLTKDELKTLTDFAQKVAHEDPRAGEHAPSQWAYA